MHADNLQLVLAYTGPTLREPNGWTRICLNHWVLDVLLRGQQWQRVQSGEPFERRPGVFALYAPGTEFHERRDAHGRGEETYMVFSARGEMEALLHRLCGDAGYCHIDDPAGLAIAPCRWLGRIRRVQSPEVETLVSGLMLETLGMLASSSPTGPQRRCLKAKPGFGKDLVEQVADYIEAHLADPISVADLAAAVNLAKSSFAHTYRQLAGETPYQAVLRNKMAAAKRMLLAEGLNVQQTAANLGFRNTCHFSRAFKRIEGLPPSEYARYL